MPAYRLDIPPHVAEIIRHLPPELRKIATMKAIPYQILIRQWLAEGIRREFRLGHL